MLFVFAIALGQGFFFYGCSFNAGLKPKCPALRNISSCSWNQSWLQINWHNLFLIHTIRTITNVPGSILASTANNSALLKIMEIILPRILFIWRCVAHFWTAGRHRNKTGESIIYFIWWNDSSMPGTWQMMHKNNGSMRDAIWLQLSVLILGIFKQKIIVYRNYFASNWIFHGFSV